MNKKIYFIRHAKSVGNVNNELHQADDSKLHEEGIDQAAKVLNRLSHLEFNTIISSDYVRCKETAEAITAISKQEIVYNQLLRERGEHESFADFCKRVIEAKIYIESLESKRVIIIGHGQWMKMFLACLMHKNSPTEEEYVFVHKFFRVVNTGVCVFNHNTEGDYIGWQLKSWNEHGHLE